MNISLHLNAEIESRLREEAAKNAMTLEQYIEQLAERAIVPNSRAAVVSFASWETAWREWAARHDTLPSSADDDRDGIYSGRGE